MFTTVINTINKYKNSNDINIKLINYMIKIYNKNIHNIMSNNDLHMLFKYTIDYNNLFLLILQYINKHALNYFDHNSIIV